MANLRKFSFEDWRIWVITGVVLAIVFAIVGYAISSPEYPPFFNEFVYVALSTIVIIELRISFDIIRPPKLDAHILDVDSAFERSIRQQLTAQKIDAIHLRRTYNISVSNYFLKPLKEGTRKVTRVFDPKRFELNFMLHHIGEAWPYLRARKDGSAIYQIYFDHVGNVGVVLLDESAASVFVYGDIDSPNASCLYVEGNKASNGEIVEFARKLIEDKHNTPTTFGTRYPVRFDAFHATFADTFEDEKVLKWLSETKILGDHIYIVEPGDFATVLDNFRKFKL